MDAADMTFSRETLQVMLRVTKGKEPFGLFLEAVREADAKAVFKKAVLECRDKGLLAGGGFTKEGFLYLRLLEEYRNAKDHFAINGILAAILPRGILISFTPVEEGYRLQAGDSSLLFATCLEKYTCLKEVEEKGSKQELSRKILWKDWVAKLPDAEGEGLLIGSYPKDGIKREEIYYWKKGQAYRYHIEKQREKEVTNAQIRQRLLSVCHLLEGETDA